MEGKKKNPRIYNYTIYCILSSNFINICYSGGTMAPRIHLKKGFAARNEWALFDSKAERIYQRIYGGIVLQGPRGAAAAVVAEEAVLRPPAPQYLVGLATAMDAAGIIERAMGFKQDLHCDTWYNDYGDQAALRFARLESGALMPSGDRQPNTPKPMEG